MTPDETITSPSNPRIRAAAALRDADARRDTGLTLVDGRRELARACASGRVPTEIFVDADAPPIADTAWLAAAADRGARVISVARRAFEKIAFGSRNEGVVGVVPFTVPDLAGSRFSAGRPLLIVEGVEKPGNLGAILRSVDATGLAGVVVCDGRTDVANPAVIRASLGTVFTVPLAAATAAETIGWCATTGRRVVAAMPTGQTLWHAARLAGDVAILVGSEAHGVSPAWTAAAAAGTIDMVSVRLPMRGVADSLNVSVTAAVLAYEALRQEESRP